MDYLLDTTILIDLLRQKAPAWDFLKKHPVDKILTSSICEAEVWEGVYRKKEDNFTVKEKALESLLQSLFNIITFDSEQAKICGQLRSTLAGKGKKIGDLDILIASAAIINKAILVTKNVKHFSRVKNLQIVTI